MAKQPTPPSAGWDFIGETMAQVARMAMEAWITSNRAQLVAEGKTKAQANQELAAKFNEAYAVSPDCRGGQDQV
jgi:phage portal protein BeeE